MKKIGLIANTQGLKGELRILSNSDFKEERFQVNNILYIEQKNELLKVEIERHYRHKNFEILKFKNYETINDVLQFKGKYLFGKELLIDNNEGNYLYEQLIDLEIYNQENKFRGVVKRVEDYGYTDMLIIEKDKKKYYLPYIDEFIEYVDLAKKKIIIKEQKGLFDEN